MNCILDSALKHKMIHKINYFEGVVTMMSLSDAVGGFSGEVAWNCADRSLFGECQLETGDQVQVISSYFGNVIIRANGKRLAITRDAAERIKLA